MGLTPPGDRRFDCILSVFRVCGYCTLASMNQPDSDLLRDYAERGSELAFAELVQRLTSFVTALARLEAWLLRVDPVTRLSVVSSEDIDDTELASLIWSLPAADYPKAWLLWQRLESRELQNRFRRALLEYWAEVDPHSAAAAAWVRRLPEGPLRRQAWEGLKSRLSWSNPEAAGDAWLQQTDLPENRKALIFATPSRSP